MKRPLLVRGQLAMNDALALLRGQPPPLLPKLDRSRRCAGCRMYHPDAFFWRGRVRAWHELVRDSDKG